MSCFTVIEVQIDDNELNRKARANLNLPLTGGLTQAQADAVRKEAGILKPQVIMRRLNPTAVVRRNGDKLTVSVNV
jgi:hypothetical protein